MSETIITGGELAILYYALAQYRGTDELSDEEAFKMGVNIAVRLIKMKLATQSPAAKVLASHYKCLFATETELYNFVQELLDKYEQKSTKAEIHDRQLAYDALRKMGSILLRDHRKLPDNLDFFAADVLDGDKKTNKKRPRPTKRGPKEDTNLSRDKALRLAYLQMCALGFNKFRSTSKKNKGDYACSYEGVSSIDIVGVAYEKISGNKLKYKTIEGLFSLINL